MNPLRHLGIAVLAWLVPSGTRLGGRLPAFLLALLLPSGLCAQAVAVAAHPSETHLANLRQLTFGGENAEAYWSLDGEWISFQATREGDGCDQIYVMRTDGSEVRRVSPGLGRTTCAYFLGPDRLVYASTLLGGGKACPPTPDRSRGYVWPLYPSYELVTQRPDGLGLSRLTRSPGYDAEATVSLDGRRIVFTSMRSGDPEIWVMDADGRNLRQLTDQEGYDGGAFFTPDGKRIVWRRTSPMSASQAADYRALLAEGLVRPSKMDLWVMDADGRNQRLVLGNGAANFAPYGRPDGKGMLFASNMDDPKGRAFDIYSVGYDGTGLERITWDESFDGFPIFSPDGRRLLFSSNRYGKQRGETNVFLADWVP